jgi:hypothetical protein
VVGVVLLVHFFISPEGGGMWISAEQLGPVLKHYWFMTKSTESNVKYTLYNGRNEVKVYTLRFNLRSPNYSHESMLEDMISKVMNKFPKEESLIGNIQYDMLLVSNSEATPSYYLWRANSNQRSTSATEEILLKKEHHQLYLFGQKATQANMADLQLQFPSSDVVVAQILTIVFTFSSA